jgi:hypothetical protein
MFYYDAREDTAYSHTHLLISVQPFVGPWRFFSFVILYRTEKAPWAEDQACGKAATYT